MISRLASSHPLSIVSCALLFVSLLGGCAHAPNQYSFVRYGQVPEEKTGAYDPEGDPVLSDRLALNYAASVASILRAKYRGSRITREASSTAQVVLAGLGGAGAAAFGYSTSTLAVLGLGSAGVPELQRIFGAKERAQIYQDAVRLIEEAQIDYLAHNQDPPKQQLTQNGVTLFQRVTASLHLVEKTLAGNLPTVEDMQKATERMTEAGALISQAGDPAVNLVPTDARPFSVEQKQRIAEAMSRGLRRPERSTTDAILAGQKESEKRFGDSTETRDAIYAANRAMNKRLIALDNRIPATEKGGVYKVIFEKADIDPKDKELSAGSGLADKKTLYEAFKWKTEHRELIRQQVEIAEKIYADPKYNPQAPAPKPSPSPAVEPDLPVKPAPQPTPAPPVTPPPSTPVRPATPIPTGTPR